GFSVRTWAWGGEGRVSRGGPYWRARATPRAGGGSFEPFGKKPATAATALTTISAATIGAGARETAADGLRAQRGATRDKGHCPRLRPRGDAALCPPVGRGRDLSGRHAAPGRRARLCRHLRRRRSRRLGADAARCRVDLRGIGARLSLDCRLYLDPQHDGMDDRCLRLERVAAALSSRPLPHG